jgi:ABC-type uncharacterized transport system permease subunit
MILVKLFVRIAPAILIAISVAIPAHIALAHIGIEGELVNLALLVASGLLGSLSDRDLFYGRDLIQGRQNHLDS